MTADAGVRPDPGGGAALPLKVWIDFVCPFCLLAEKPLREATEGLDVSIEWMPFELRPYPTPTLRPEDEYLPRVWRQAVYPMAARMGVPIRLPDVSPQPYSRLAFEGLQFAKAHGRDEAYVDAVLRAFFQRSEDIGGPEVLRVIAEEAGLPAAAFAAALREGRYRREHDAALRAAQALGIRAVPTILVGDRRIEGVAGPDVLRRAIEENLASPVGG